MKETLAPALCAVLSLVTVPAVFGQGPGPADLMARDADGAVTVRAVRVDVPLRIDGQLNESLYELTTPISDFRQNEPDNGAAATERTEIWLAFDDDNFYIGVRAYESDPERTIANEMQRDSFNIVNGDHVAVMLDTFNDKRNGIVLQWNSLGGRWDAQSGAGGLPNADWNPLWSLATAEFDGGWASEAAIPFKSISYGPGDQWGFNARRFSRSKNETSYVTSLPPGRALIGIMQASFGAPLNGIQAPPSSRTVDVKPYVIGDVSTDVSAGARNDPSADAGLDARVSITPNLAAEFTVNTDFAQVEADDQQVNLTRFSLFFPEKREFFLENQGLFSFGGGGRGGGPPGGGGGNDVPTMFYSRRIGLEAGHEIPIRAGARVSGRVGDYSLGLINMQTGEDDAVASPSTNFTVARVRRDILRRSSIGAIATVRSNTLDQAGAAATYGVDGDFSFRDVLTFNTYWARVDNPGVGDGDVSYRAQGQLDMDLVDLTVDHLRVGEHFDPAVGFVRRRDMRRTFVGGSYNPRPTWSEAIRQLRFSARVEYIENGAGTVENRTYEGDIQVQFENSDQVEIESGYAYELLPRGFRVAAGVVIPQGAYDGAQTRIAYRLGQQRRVSGMVSVQRNAFYGGTSMAYGYNMGRIDIHPQFSLQPGVGITDVDTPFGDFTTKLVSSRATYTITPLMFVSGLIQYNSSNSSLSTNLRMRWEYQPGSELFVVYNDGRDTSGVGFPELQNRSFVVKINRLFRF